MCWHPFDLGECGIRSWNRLISNVLPVRDKSDEEELEPAGWKTSEQIELMGVGAVWSLTVKGEEEGHSESRG